MCWLGMCVDGLISFPLLSHLLVECECQNVLSPSGKDLLIWIQGSIASLGSSHGQPSPDLAHIVQTYESAGMPCAFRCRLDNPGEQRCSGRILMDFGAETGHPSGRWRIGLFALRRAFIFAKARSFATRRSWIGLSHVQCTATCSTICGHQTVLCLGLLFCSRAEDL